MKTEISGIYISSEELEHLKELFQQDLNFELGHTPAAKTEKLEKAVRELEDLYHAAPCGYHSLETNGYFIRINETGLEWLGEKRESLLGQKTLEEMLHPDSRTLFRRNFDRLKEYGKLEDIEYILQPEEGPVRPVLLSATALYNKRGEFVMSREVLYDISHRKQMEDRLKRINSFRDMLMHEVLVETREIRLALEHMNDAEKNYRINLLCDHIERLARMSASV